MTTNVGRDGKASTLSTRELYELRVMVVVVTDARRSKEDAGSEKDCVQE